LLSIQKNSATQAVILLFAGQGKSPALEINRENWPTLLQAQFPQLETTTLGLTKVLVQQTPDIQMARSRDMF
jgi:hypothetical protein